MRRRLLPGLFCIALAGAAAGQDATLDKMTSREDTLGWEAVGRIDLGDRGFCTGVLIAPDEVLTAAHCVFDPAAAFAPVKPDAMRFRAGLRNGEAVAEQTVAAYVTHPDYVAGPVPTALSVRSDLALLRLGAAIPAAIAAPFPVSPLTAAQREVGVVSFAASRSEAPSIQRSCRVLGREPGLFVFSCDVDFGSSGAPVFDMSDRRARIVSVISAGNRENGKMLSFGMELPGRVDELRRALRSGEGVHTADGGGSTPTLRLGGAARTAAGGARFVKPPAP